MNTGGGSVRDGIFTKIQVGKESFYSQEKLSIQYVIRRNLNFQMEFKLTKQYLRRAVE